MTTLANRPNTALLVVDLQNAVVAGAFNRDAVVANVIALVETARREGAHIIRESEGWRIVSELRPDADGTVIDKTYGDAFEATDLEQVLPGLRVGRLVVAGAQTDACIRSTLHSALVRGCDVLLASDAHTTEDQTAWGAPPPEQVIAHTNLYWAYQTAPGRTAAVMETCDIDFGRMA